MLFKFQWQNFRTPFLFGPGFTSISQKLIEETNNETFCKDFYKLRGMRMCLLRSINFLEYGSSLVSYELRHVSTLEVPFWFYAGDVDLFMFRACFVIFTTSSSMPHFFPDGKFLITFSTSYNLKSCASHLTSYESKTYFNSCFCDSCESYLVAKYCSLGFFTTASTVLG